MQSLPCIQTGCHTIALRIPYSATWRVPGVQRHDSGVLSVYGRFFNMQTIRVNCGKYKRTFWKLTIHAGRPHQLLSAKSLLRRVKSVLATLDAPAYIVHAIQTGGIKLVRVDLASDYRIQGTIQPDEIDGKEHKIKRMTDSTGYFGTLYIQTKKRTVVECRYDKQKELYEVYGIRTTKPTSRIERRFHGSRSCTRHGVRTLPALCDYLRRMRRRLRADQATHDRGRSHLAPAHPRRRRGGAFAELFFSYPCALSPFPPFAAPKIA